MKKFISIILTVAIVLSLSTGVSASLSGFTVGDALTVLKHLAGIQELTDHQIELYDFFDTGELTIDNVLAILKDIAGIDKLPDDFNLWQVGGDGISFTMPRLVIEDVRNVNLRSEIANEVSEAKLISRLNWGFMAYAHNRISEIEEFYLPAPEIHGFELYMVQVNPRFFFFDYVLENTAPYPNGGYPSDKTMTVSISRESFTLYELWEDMSSTNMVFEGDYIHLSGFEKSMWSVMGDKIFNIAVPTDDLNDFDILRGIADELIRTAELVDVQYELDVMRSMRD
jgi:hypothetical protein